MLLAADNSLEKSRRITIGTLLRLKGAVRLRVWAKDLRARLPLPTKQHPVQNASE